MHAFNPKYAFQSKPGSTPEREKDKKKPRKQKRKTTKLTLSPSIVGYFDIHVLFIVVSQLCLQDHHKCKDNPIDRKKGFSI